MELTVLTLSFKLLELFNIKNYSVITTSDSPSPPYAEEHRPKEPVRRASTGPYVEQRRRVLTCCPVSGEEEPGAVVALSYLMLPEGDTQVKRCGPLLM